MILGISAIFEEKNYFSNRLNEKFILNSFDETKTTNNNE